jgi:hypothetical protein
MKRSARLNSLNISKIDEDEDEDIENETNKSQFNNELVRSTTSLSLPTTKKEVNYRSFQFKKKYSKFF